MLPLLLLTHLLTMLSKVWENNGIHSSQMQPMTALMYKKASIHHPLRLPHRLYLDAKIHENEPKLVKRIAASNIGQPILGTAT